MTFKFDEPFEVEAEAAVPPPARPITAPAFDFGAPFDVEPEPFDRFENLRRVGRAAATAWDAPLGPNPADPLWNVPIVGPIARGVLQAGDAAIIRPVDTVLRGGARAVRNIAEAFPALTGGASPEAVERDIYGLATMGPLSAFGLGMPLTQRPREMRGAPVASPAPDGAPPPVAPSSPSPTPPTAPPITAPSLSGVGVGPKPPPPRNTYRIQQDQLTSFAEAEAIHKAEMNAWDAWHGRPLSYPEAASSTPSAPMPRQAGGASGAPPPSSLPEAPVPGSAAGVAQPRPAGPATAPSGSNLGTVTTEISWLDALANATEAHPPPIMAPRPLGEPVPLRALPQPRPAAPVAPAPTAPAPATGALPPVVPPPVTPSAPAAPPQADAAEAPPVPAAPPPVGPGEQAAAEPAAAPPAPPPPIMAPPVTPMDPGPAQAVQQLADMLADPRTAEEIAAGAGQPPAVGASPGDPPAIPPSSPAGPPLRPQTADDVAAAASQAVQPTPAQAKAGNYRKGHINLDGMDISIETAQGGTRSGIDDDGEPWSVEMPADYGQILGTRGADGDPLDTYLGPDAHAAKQRPVFVIDQKNLRGGAFDEHKAMLGFPSRQAAIDAYVAAFNDGRGLERMGAVTQMPWETFKSWARGDLSRPLRYKRRPPPREKGTRRSTSLLEFLASKGGLADNGDLRAMDLQRKFLPRYGRVVRRNGMDLDTAREAAEEAGYLGMRPGDYSQSTIRDLLDAIDEELRGRPQFSSFEDGNRLVAEQERRAEEAEVRQKDAEDEIRAVATELNIRGLRNYEIDDAVRFMLTEGYTAEEALAEALSLHASRWLEEARQIAQDAGEDIPFDLEETPNGLLPVPAAPSGEGDAGDSQRGEGPDAADAPGRPPAGGSPGGAGQGGQGAQGGEGRPDGGQRDEPRPGAGAAGQEGGGGGVTLPQREQLDRLRRNLANTVSQAGKRYNTLTTQAEAYARDQEPGRGQFFGRGATTWTRRQEGWFREKLTELVEKERGAFSALVTRAERLMGAEAERARRAGVNEAWDLGRVAERYGDYRLVAAYIKGEGPIASAFSPRTEEPAAPKTEKVDTLDGVRDQGLLDGVAEPLPGVRGTPSKKPAAQAEPGGMFSAGVRQTDLEGQIRAEDAALFGNLAAPNTAALGQAFAGEFANGRKFSSIVQARQFASSKLGGPVQPGTMTAKAVDEAVELGVVIRARAIASGPGSNAEKFDQLVALYGQQPTLGTRTSDSVERQAYSTPAPLAFAAGILGGLPDADKVYEPTAGNGMLLVTANETAIIANELDGDRRDLLRAQGINPTGRDATEAGIVTDRSVDAVIANPPFGALKDAQGATTRFDMGFVQRGYTTGEIDHAIALRALEGMKDDGRAVLILGGLNKLITGEQARADGYNGKAKREFFFTLYEKYGVIDHFTVPGNMYAKQGAGWPVDVIVIEGRRKSARKLPSVSAPRVISSWDDLKGMLDASNPVLAVPNGDPSGMGSTGPAAGTGGDPAAGAGPGPAPANEPVAPAAQRPPGVDAGPRGEPVGVSEPAGAGDGGAGVLGGADPVRQPAGGRGPSAGGEPGVSAPAVPEQPASGPGPMAGDSPAGGTDRGRGDEPAGVDGSPATGDGRPSLAPAAPRPKRERKPAQEAPSATQTPYEPASSLPSVDTLVPTNMRTAVREALTRQEQAAGKSIDAFVAEKLGYPPADLGKYFSAEQVDALGLAIKQIDAGAGFVIGDQTGVGKGRFVAGLIRYAERSGLTPVFVTEKPNLYADMARDLTAIGMPDMVDAIFATNASLRLQLTDDPDGPKLRTGAGEEHDPIVDRAASARKLPEGKRVMFTTYSQMQRVNGAATQRMRLMLSLAPNSFVILDEAHNAGGAGVNGDPDGATRSSFFRGIVAQARSVAYSSATWAKRPDVLDLYGAKTDMRLAVPELSKLAEAIAKGGVPMQQIVTAQLAQVGQYTRREKSFQGVKYGLQPVEVDREAYDQVADVLGRIFTISDRYVKPAIKEISKELRDEAKSLSGDGSTGKAGATTTGFASVMHNLVNQLLLASKAPATVERALAALKDGKKPVIALANTMGSFIAEYAEMAGARPGEALDLNFNTLLKRYLQRTLRYTEKKPFSKEKGTVRFLKPEDLGYGGEELFRETEELIDSLDLSSFPVVPIDYIRAKLEEAGYKIGEVTGRTEAATYTKDGKVVYRQRSTKELSPNGRQSAIRAFNSGQLDVMILNQSGATGLSLHAAKDFKDQRQRVMLLAQAEANIDTHMQMLGRVHRTGQIITPEYEQLFANVPAENRPAAVLAKKMASLNASTTANRTSNFSSSDTPDVMNIYGGQVIAQILAEDRDLDLALGEVSEGGGRRGEEDSGSGVDYEELARKVTGRLPLLSLERQEAVWTDIIERYKRAIQAADEAGENVLEAKTLDLDAKIITEHQLDDDAAAAPAGQEDNPFAAPAKLVSMDVRRLVTPPSSARILAETMAGLGMGTIADVEKQFAQATDGEIARALATIDIGQASNRQRAEHGVEIGKALQARLGGIAKQFSDPAKADQARAAAMATAGRLRDTIEQALHGDLLTIRSPSDEPGEGMTVLVIGTRLRGDRALAPSSWDLIVVDGEGRRRAIPLSWFKMSDDKADTGFVMEAPPEGRTVKSFLETLAEGAGEARETRAMVTGNILKGYAKLGGRGQIINYLDSEGEMRQGILLSRTFDIEAYLASQAPTLTPERALEVLRSDSTRTLPFVTHSQAAFTISATDKGGFAMSVPQSKAKGGPYYLSPAVRNAIGGSFVSRGGKMVAQVKAENLSDLLFAVAAVMRKEGGAFSSSHEAAAKYAPKKKPAGDARMAVGWDAVGEAPDSAYQPEAIAAALAAVRAVIGPQARAEVRGGLQDPMGRARDVGGVTIGPLMMVAVGPRAPWNIHHEAVHVLRNLGVLSPGEWRTLEDAARRQGWMQAFAILQRYASLPAEKQMEEAVAEKFAQWSTGQAAPKGGPLARAWGRVRTTVDRVRNALSGRGFQTADDVFRRMASGEVGQRAPGSQAPQRGPQSFDQALAAATFFDTFADVPTDLKAVLEEAARFAINPAPQGRMSTAQPVTFAAPGVPQTKIGRAIDAAIHGMQDKNLDTKDTIAAIQKAGRVVTEAADARLREELFHYRVQKRMKDFARHEMQPLMDALAERKVPLADLEAFLWLRHAEERNAQIARVNPAMPDGGSGLTDAEAAARMAAIPAARRQDLDILARYVDAITAGTRALWARYELEDQRVIRAMQNAYQHYVPLYREEMEAQGPQQGTGAGFSTSGSASRRAMGSERPVVDILAHIAIARERAIIRGEKNIVSNALLQLARDHPNPEFWTIDEKPTKRFIDPDTGLVRSMVDPTWKGHDNVIVARALNNRGELVEHGLFFNEKNPRALRMAMAMRNLDVDKVPWLWGTLLGVPTRILAKLSTQWNPIFGAVNLIRDTQETLINLSSTPVRGRRMQILADIPKAAWAVYRASRRENAGLPASPRGISQTQREWRDLWEEFQQVGGPTAFRDLFETAEERTQALEADLRRVMEGKGKGAWRAIGDWLTHFNDALENATRLAVYKAAKDAGLSRAKAASVAKNITVNFNRKGAQTNQIGAVFAFFNAAVQGIARSFQTYASPAGKTIIAGGLALGLVQELVLRAAGLEDADIPDFVKERNFVIPTFIGKGYGTIPMALGYMILPNIGRVTTSMVLDAGEGAVDKMGKLARTVADAYNPLGSSAGGLPAILTPTALDPVIALYMNRSWTGRQIAIEPRGGMDPTPGYLRASRSASWLATEAAYTLNRVTFGTQDTAGWLSPTPDQLEYLVRQYSGGLGGEFIKGYKTGSALAQGEAPELKDIPLVSRFAGSASTRASTTSTYYETLKRMREHEAIVKGRENRGEDVDAYLRQFPEAELALAPGFRVASPLSKVQRDISKLRTEQRQLGDRANPRHKEIDDEILQVMAEFVAEVREARKPAGR